MLKLKNITIVNGLTYKVIKRSDKVVLFSIQDGRKFEVTRIYILPKASFMSYVYPEREAVSNNAQFGRDGSKLFNDMDQAIIYFAKLNKAHDGVLEERITNQFDGELDRNINHEVKVAQNRDSSNPSVRKPELIALPSSFRKNSMNYTLIMRNDLAVMYALSDGSMKVGYEVCPIKVYPSRTKFDRLYAEKEALPSDEKFGMEGSKAFFPHEFERAAMYYDQLTTILEKKKDR